jgi:hypothetical protein
MRQDEGERATLASHDAYSPYAVAERVIQEAHSLAAEFENLCFEFTSPEYAQEYGTDYSLAKMGGSPCHDDENNSGPKKGSLRVFAQQVRLSVAVSVVLLRVEPTIFQAAKGWGA